MSNTEMTLFVTINVLLFLLFGRVYFGSFSKTISVFFHALSRSPRRRFRLRVSDANSEPSELLFGFFCAMFVVAELLWLSKF